MNIEDIFPVTALAQLRALYMRMHGAKSDAYRDYIHETLRSNYRSLLAKKMDDDPEWRRILHGSVRVGLLILDVMVAENAPAFYHAATILANAFLETFQETDDYDEQWSALQQYQIFSQPLKASPSDWEDHIERSSKP